VSRGTVFRIKGYKDIFKCFVDNKLLILTTLFLIIGIFFGVFFYDKYSLLKEIPENFLNGFIEKRIDATFFKIFFDSFLGSMIIFVSLFAFGTSMLGVVFIPMIVALNGVFYGSLVSFLYAEFSLKGIAFHTVIFVPTVIFIIIGTILASLQSLDFSFLLAKHTFYEDSSKPIYENFKKYSVKFSLYILLFLIAALIDALISVNLLSSFNL